MIYDQKVHKRPFGVDGIDHLMWLECDNGAWEGPKDDWTSSHKDKYTKYCKKTDIAVTAGGNMGMYPLLLSKIFTTIYTFEPEPMNFHCLVNNCQSENIIKIQAALGDTHKMIQMNIVDITNCGMHRVSKDETGVIPMLMLDDFEFPTLDFIQLDSEGYEYNILNGAVKTITKHKPVISAENGHTDQIIELMNSLGYVKVDQSSADHIYIPKE